MFSASTSTSVVNYTFILKCKPNEHITKWVKTHLGDESKIEGIAEEKLKISTDELNTGLHISLLFAGNMHAIYQEKAAEINKDIEEIFSKHNMLTKLTATKVAAFGVTSQWVALELKQENDVFKKCREEIRKVLTEKYFIRVPKDLFEFSLHLSLAQTTKFVEKDNKKTQTCVPKEIIDGLNGVFDRCENKDIFPDADKFELSSAIGQGPTATRTIVAAFKMITPDAANNTTHKNFLMR